MLEGYSHPHFIDDQDDEEHAQVGYVGDDVQVEEHNVGDDLNQEEWPQDDASIPSFPTQGGASGSSGHDIPLWEQVLANQQAMQQ